MHERIRLLREALMNLETLRSVSKADFVAAFQHYWLAERGLQIAAEAVFDIGNHILAGQFSEHAPDYESVLRGLGAHGAISEALGARLAGLGGFRNVLVHGYARLDRERVHDVLHTRLPDFADFATEIEALLARLARR